jgi:hypothetical protein
MTTGEELAQEQGAEQGILQYINTRMDLWWAECIDKAEA